MKNSSWKSRAEKVSSPVQLVLNAAARLVVKKRKWDSITPTIRDNLHWLLVQQGVDFKICILVYKCLHQLVAKYLVSMISPVSAVSTRCHLRSAGQGDLVVPRTRTTGFGPRSFSVAGQLAWNSLRWKLRHHWHSDSSLAGWKLKCFYVAILRVSAAVIISIIRLHET